MSVVKKLLFCLAVGLFLSQGMLASAAGVAGSLDAGGFTGQSFAWDYSFYVSGVVSATTDDPEHIVWNGLTATINYSTAGDRTVNFTFKTSGGTVYNGTGRIRIADKQEWNEKPRVGWYNYEFDDFMSGNVDYAATVNSANKLNINTIAPYYFYGSDTGGYETLLSNLGSLNHWPIIYGADMNQGPYHADFVSWAGYFANLSLTHHNLQAMVIDDYDPSVNTAFTHAYSVEIMQAKNRVNPNFKILPVLYYDYELHWFDPGNPWYSQNNPIVSPFTDGIMMFYWGSWTKTAPVVANFTSLLDRAATFSHVPFYSGFYPISYEPTLDESSRFSSVADAQAMLVAAASKSAGVAVYYVPLWTNDIARFTSPQSLATVFKQAANDDPAFGYRFNLIFWAETCMGWYKGITQTITAPATVSSANISFNIKDTIASGTTGIHFKQLLVNGRVVWEADAAGDGNGSTVITKNIAPYLTAGQPATLAIRVYDRRNTSFYPIDVYVGNIAININGLPFANNWSLKSGIDDAVLQNYKDTFSAISSGFAVAVNTPPALATIGAKSVVIGNSLTFTIFATDADDDTLTYSASNLPAGASFNASTRQFSWTPTSAQAGSYPNVLFSVSDGKGGADSEDITITVSAASSIGGGSSGGGGGLSGGTSSAQTAVSSMLSSGSNLSSATSTNPVVKMTRDQILAAIKRIMALIAQLQAQLNALLGNSGGGTKYSCAKIGKNLYYGMKNDPQVKCLQEVLRAQGFAVALSSNYDLVTKIAVSRFQQKYAAEILTPFHLKYGSGNAGNETMAKINELLKK